MNMLRVAAAACAVAAVAGCSSETVSPATASHRTVAVTDGVDGAPANAAANLSSNGNVEASGVYQFFVPADYNGGIFGGSIDNRVDFEAHRNPHGKVTGRFKYVQTFDGSPSEFSGSVTCVAIYDTPVLQNFPGIPAMTHNRAKWGGVIERSTDPTIPVGTYIWFQSIDNHAHGSSHSAYPDLSTLSGFGDNAANEAFCASPKVPNPNFGPHAVQRGHIDVH